MADISCAPEVFLNRIETHIDRMPSLSVTSTRVLEICNNPRTSAIDLNRVIELDPVLMGQVLRLVNSAFYGRRHSVTTLPRAIIMLGVNTVKNLVLSLAVLKVMKEGVEYTVFSMEDFWMHSLCTGVAARWLADAKRLPSDVCWDCFVGGLLHDLGKIPLNSLFPAEYSDIFANAAENRVPLHAAEQSVLGFDHMQVGGMIARKWKLGAMLEDCLASHHCPDKAHFRNAARVGIVELADLCAKIYEIGSAGGPPSSDAELASLSAERGFSDEDLGALKAALAEEVENARTFLQLTKRGGQA